MGKPDASMIVRLYHRKAICVNEKLLTFFGDEVEYMKVIASTFCYDLHRELYRCKKAILER